MYTNRVFRTAKLSCLLRWSSFKGVLVKRFFSIIYIPLSHYTMMLDICDLIAPLFPLQ